MNVTPIGVARDFMLDLPLLARPAALLGAFAIVMLVGGVTGAASFQIRAGAVIRGLISGCTIAAALWWSFPAVNRISQVAFAVLFAALLTFVAHCSGRSVSRGHARKSNFRGGPKESRATFLAETTAVLGAAVLLIGLMDLRPFFWGPVKRKFFAYRPPAGLNRSVASLVTPADRFYVVDDALEYPAVLLESWKLTVDDDNGRSRKFTFDELVSLPRVSRYITLECIDNPVGGPLMGNALWTGVSMATLIGEASPPSAALVFAGADGYTDGAPRQLLERSGALLAFAMNGASLPDAHGYPVRLIFPGVYGLKSVKWLERMTVTRQPYQELWRSHGWSELSEIQTTSRIDVSRRVGDRIALGGIAFAGLRGIRRVQLRMNGGPWNEASLGPRLSSQSWVQWSAVLISPKETLVEVRAIDGLGRAQMRRQRDSYPNGATGWPSIRI